MIRKVLYSLLFLVVLLIFGVYVAVQLGCSSPI